MGDVILNKVLNKSNGISQASGGSDWADMSLPRPSANHSWTP